MTIPLTKAARAGPTAPTRECQTFSSDRPSASLQLKMVDDDGESVKLTFGTLPTGVSAGATASTTVSITDDDVPDDVRVSFPEGSYTVAEGASVEIEVVLSTAPERQVVIQISPTGQGGASSTDYSVPSSVTFASDETEKTFTFTATDDNDNDDGERVWLRFGTPPSGVTADTSVPLGDNRGLDNTTVSITDNDHPAVEVTFAESTYTVAEGATTTVTVHLSAVPERSVIIPLNSDNIGGATSADYSVPTSVTFGSGDVQKTIEFGATDDSVNDDGERVRLSFGMLPTAVTAGATASTTISITDNDDQSVSASFEQATYTVAEGSSVTVKVTLSADPERSVTVPLTNTNQAGATSTDYSGVPASITFDSGDTSRTFTFTAISDSDNDDGESVKLGFGTLPMGVSAGITDETTVTITDDDVPSVNVSFATSTYTVNEGSSINIAVSLSADPERTVTIPLTITNQGGATDADHSLVPEGITFNSGQTSRTFNFQADQDSDNDDGESVKLGFGTLPTSVSAGTTASTTVSITDDDHPTVTVSFEQATYTVAEGSSVTVKVKLSAAHGSNFQVPLTMSNQGGASTTDYSLGVTSVNFNSGDISKTVAFNATQDTVDDDGESVKIGFGALPTGVSFGSPNETTVSITDDDDPVLTVRFEQATYTVAEGSSVSVKVALDAAPEREVTIPITATNQGGATSTDYSGVPASVTFGVTDTEKSFTFSADDDDVDDDGESVKLAFGTLPAQVAGGATDEAVVSITDDDAPTSVAVSFGQSTYSVAEGSAVTITVQLDDDPEKTVTVPVSAAGQNGASADDYSGVPASVTFNSGDTSKSFSFTAASRRLRRRRRERGSGVRDAPLRGYSRYNRHDDGEHHRRRRARRDGRLRRRNVHRGRGRAASQ